MEPFDLNIRHLRALAAIVEVGSISADARIVNLTQPAITQGIAKLERQLDLTLFERRPAGMVPTQAAKLMAPRIEAALRLLNCGHATGAQISAFLAVARCGGYAGAAAQTGLSEPSLHRSVGDLSVTMGHRLVERRGKRLAMTTRGLAVARRFRLGEAELKSALSDLSLLKGQEVGRIVVGAMPLSRARLLPAAVASFHLQHRDVRLSVLEGSHAELVGPLLDGEVDMIVGAVRDLPAGTELAQLPLFKDRPVIIGRPEHPLVKRKAPLTADDMIAYPWITPAEGTPLRAQWEAMFKAVDVEAPDVAIECGAVIMVRQMLMHSDFLTLLSPDQVAVELEAGWLVKVADAPGDVTRTIGVTTRVDWRPTAIQQHFLDAITSQAALIVTQV